MFPTIRTDLELTPLGNELIVVDATTDATHTLAPVAAAVLRAADGTRDIAALEEVAQAIDPTVDRKSLWALLDRFAGAGLMTAAATPVAATTHLGRRAWMTTLVAGGAAAIAGTLVARSAEAKRSPAKEALKKQQQVCREPVADHIEEAVKLTRADEARVVYRSERAAKAKIDRVRTDMVQRIRPKNEERYKQASEQSRKREYLGTEVGGGAPGWLDLGIGAVLEVSLLADGSVLPADATPTTVTLELRTTFDEDGAVESAARVKVAAEEREKREKLAGQGKEPDPALLKSEQAAKAILAQPTAALKAHSFDMQRITDLIATSQSFPQVVTLALGANAFLVGQLEVLGGEITHAGTDDGGAPVADRVQLLVRLPMGADAMLPDADDVEVCREVDKIPGEITASELTYARGTIGFPPRFLNITLSSAFDL